MGQRGAEEHNENAQYEKWRPTARCRSNWKENRAGYGQKTGYKEKK
jgi:hypothetical protein